MNVNMITNEELQNFKRELLVDIGKLLNDKPAPPKWLKSYQVRDLLGISRGTLNHMYNSGTLPATRIGGLLFFNHDDIVKLMEKNKRR